jgi:predicted metal-binding protein
MKSSCPQLVRLIVCSQCQQCWHNNANSVGTTMQTVLAQQCQQCWHTFLVPGSLAAYLHRSTFAS